MPNTTISNVSTTSSTTSQMKLDREQDGFYNFGNISGPVIGDKCTGLVINSRNCALKGFGHVDEVRLSLVYGCVTADDAVVQASACNQKSCKAHDAEETGAREKDEVAWP